MVGSVGYDQSSAGDSERGDKYRTLALEYSKLKSAFHVLKAAYVDANDDLSRTKVSESDKDIQLRQQDRDIDTLKFINEQMVHRVEILQGDLAKLSARQGRSNKTPTTNNGSDQVLRTELQKKLEENESLHRRIFESEAAFSAEISSMEERNEQISQQLHKTRDFLTTATESYQKNNRVLEQKVSSLNADVEERDREISRLRGERQEILESARVLQEKSEVETTLNPRLEAFLGDSMREAFDEIDLCCREGVGLTREFMSRLSNVLVCVLKSLVELHATLGRRCLSFARAERAVEISSLFIHCGDYLERANGHLRRLFFSSRTAFSISLATLSDLPPFMSCWRNYSSSFAYLLEYVETCFADELTLLGSPASVGAKLTSVRDTLFKYNLVCRNIHDVYSPAAQSGDFLSDQFYRPLHVEMSLIDTLKSFFMALSDMAVNFDSLLSYEAQLPNLSPEHVLHNESLSTCITGIWNNVKEMNMVMENAKYFVDSLRERSDPMKPRFCCPCANEFHQRASSLSEVLQSMESPPHLDYAEAIESRNQVHALKYSVKTLGEQSEAFRAQIARLEGEKEHWMLEFQLTRAKLKQAKQSYVEERPSLESLSDIQSAPPSSQREELIRQHFNERISSISCQLQKVDSKAVFYQSECHALEEQMEQMRVEREDISTQLRSRQTDYDRLQEEFDISVREYSNQLTTMSLLNASLNEKIEQFEGKNIASTGFMRKVKNLRKN